MLLYILQRLRQFLVIPGLEFGAFRGVNRSNYATRHCFQLLSHQIVVVQAIGISFELKMTRQSAYGHFIRKGRGSKYPSLPRLQHGQSEESSRRSTNQATRNGCYRFGTTRHNGDY